MNLTFVALKKSQPNVFAARRTKAIARASVTQMPPSMPRRTLRKSPAPRTSPYRVAPQFGYRIQNIMNGRSRNVSGPEPEVERRAAGQNASLAAGVVDRRLVGVGDAEQALARPVEGGLEVSCDETSMSTNMTARAMRPMYRLNRWIRA